MVEIEWAPSAEKDLFEIIDYIAQDSPQYASLFYDQIRQKVEDLNSFPKLGRKVPELDDPNLRELILRNYRLIYQIFGEKIKIIRILHGSRILIL